MKRAIMGAKRRSRRGQVEAANNIAVGYVRVSSQEQEKEGFSVPAQAKLLKDYAVIKGLSIADMFVDVETAKVSGRPEFARMIDYLKKHPSVRVVLVEKTDRLYRNFRDVADIQDLDVELHLIKENEILKRDSRSHQKLIHGIKVVMAKQ
jgi:site-specific DNA recombinase